MRNPIVFNARRVNIAPAQFLVSNELSSLDLEINFFVRGAPQEGRGNITCRGTPEKKTILFLCREVNIDFSSILTMLNVSSFYFQQLFVKFREHIINIDRKRDYFCARRRNLDEKTSQITRINPNVSTKCSWHF